MMRYIKDNWYIIFCGSALFLQVVFAILKKVGVVQWSMWIVLLPSIILAVSVLALVVLVVALAFGDDDWGDDSGYSPYDG